ncbi:hypothetical protein PsorP6_002363 [Peronosclerospora sorghi]|uniref:Uncharacterized protein n=1 Tax=Peronosclerospora sorghi TaxID=230839 RepID=A0ACC0WW22_9STRA|nr:hypothetical protein PsorP6_002363 [Peronosclerospora sorghi]
MKVPIAIAEVPKLTAEGKQLPVGNGGVAANYSWTQTLEDISIQMVLKNHTQAKDLECRIESTRLSVTLKIYGHWRAITFSIFRLKRPNLLGGYATKRDPEIDTRQVDSRRDIHEYDEGTQGAIRKAVYDQRQQQLSGARGEKESQEASRLEKARTCALSSQPLREPVVACRLGNLFNKQTVLEHLLAKAMPERFEHITSLKDVVTCQVTFEKGKEDALWCCPITMIEFNGKQPFVVLFQCGCVLSERALKAVETSACLVCSKPFEKQDVVTLLLDEKYYEEKKQMLLEQKAEKMKNKRKVKRVNGEDKKDGRHKLQKKSKRKLERLDDETNTNRFKIAKELSESTSKAKKKSQVFASIFSKDKGKKTSANDLLMTIGGMRYTLS